MKPIIIITILFLASCSPKSPEAAKKQISTHKEKIQELNQKIAALEEAFPEGALDQSAGHKTRVELEELEYKYFAHYITVSGTVAPVQEAFISPEINGQVSSVHVRDGQRVRKGQLLISLKTDVTEASVREVKTGLELAVKLYERQKELWEQKIGSEVQYLQAKNNKEALEASLSTLEEQMRMASIIAPFDGIVDKVFIKQGEMASPGVRLLHMVNLRNLRIVADISERYLSDIQEGEKVDISFPAFPVEMKTLPITRIGNVIDNRSRTFEVEVRYDNPGEQIKPNQFVNMRINDYSSTEALVVPSILIRQDIEGYFLFIAAGDRDNLVAEKVYVKPGRSYMDETMVEEGLNPGDRIIVRGYNLVRSGSEISYSGI